MGDRRCWRLVRERRRAPHRPGPRTRGRCAPSLDCVWRVGAGSGQQQAQDARGTRSAFLSWEGSWNCLASLVAELPEDKRLDYKADRGRTAEMPRERRNQALRGRSQAGGHRLAATSDPALGGSASTGRPLSRSLSSRQRSQQLCQHRPAQLSVPSQGPPAAWENTFPARRTGCLAGWQWGLCLQQRHIPRTRPLTRGLPGTGSWEWGPGSARAPL